MREYKNYDKLCELVDIEPEYQKINLSKFLTKEEMATRSSNERLAASLQAFITMLLKENKVIDCLDNSLLDAYIAKIDIAIGNQLDEILHNGDFQKCESIWRSLKYLVDNTNFNSNIKIEILNVSKETLQNDFEDSQGLTQTNLYNHIYTQEYDTPGGEPISAIISDYVFDSKAYDIKLLSNISKIAAAAHCPFIANVGSEFFNKNSIEGVTKIKDLNTYMERTEYTSWNAFRETEDSRYIGLTLPRFLLRLPYGEQNPTKNFLYTEQVFGEIPDSYLWGNASFALGVNIARSFQKYGWSLNIRGPESGGKVEELPIHQYDIGRGIQTKIPSETIISETRELEYANLGFIPLCYYKNSNFTCFFSANSSQKPQEFSTPLATANSRINARLPYIFLTSRLGHYLKVLQRENIGTNKNRLELENELNEWMQTLVTKMNNPGPELASTHPLSAGHITVEDIPENPGFYKVIMYAIPHFQIEGMDVQLSLVSKLPTKTK